MSKLIISYDDTGTITAWRYEADEDYTPGEQELAADVDHRDLAALQADLSGDTPQLADNPNYQPPAELDDVASRLNDLEGDHPVARQRVSDSQKQSFRDARAVDDLQGQLDVLFEIVTGDKP